MTDQGHHGDDLHPRQTWGETYDASNGVAIRDVAHVEMMVVLTGPPHPVRPGSHVKWRDP